MKTESTLGKALIVHLVLLAYWFPALIADTVIQFSTCWKYDGTCHIYTDYATNWGQALISVHLITSIAITAMDMKYNGVTEMLIHLRNRVAHVAMLFSILLTLDFVVLQSESGIYKVSKWTLQHVHEHLMNSIVMLISVFSLNCHFRKRDFWLGK